MPDQPGRFCLLTGPGPAAIAVIQVTGPGVRDLCARLAGLAAERLPDDGRIRLTTLHVDTEGPIDEILLSAHGEDELRLHLHGSPWNVQRLRRALWGLGLTETAQMVRRDGDALDRAAWQLASEMPTLAGVAWAAEQPRRIRAALRAAEGESPERARRRLRAMLAAAACRGWYRKPIRFAVVGPPNAGKSTLINALTRRQACLVSDQAGTTRDWVEVPAELAGFPVTWLDTAGVHETADPLEAEGIARTRAQLAAADGVLVVLAGDEAIQVDGWERLVPRPVVVVRNKADRSPAWGLSALPVAWRSRVVGLSATAGVGLEALIAAIPGGVGRDVSQIVRAACFTDDFSAVARAACAAEAADFAAALAGLRAGLSG